MVNFRFHVVSLVAVFLALSIGLIMGTTVISEGLVSQLRRDARDFRERNDQYRAQTEALEARLGVHDRFGATLLETMAAGRLAGQGATMLIQDGAPRETIDRVAEALRIAGIPKPARLTLTGPWALEVEQDRVRLAAATGATSQEPQALVEQAARILGARLTAPADPRAESDVVRRLGEAGFVKTADVPPGPFPSSAARLLVVIPASTPEAVPSHADFFVPMLRALAGKRPVAVAESLGAASSLVARVRDDESLRETVATVDHADTAAGQISLVRVLGAVGAGRDESLHYGVLDGAARVAPPLSAPAATR